MKRMLIVVVALAVVIGGAVGGLALTRVVPPSQGSIDAAETLAPSPPPEATPPAGSATASAPGSYVDYSDTAIADATGRVVLFFHAPWCGQCVQLDKDITADGAPDGVTIIKVDWDSNQALEEKYGVPMRTTFVELSDDGEVVQRHVAYDEPRLSAVVDAMNL